MTPEVPSTLPAKLTGLKFLYLVFFAIVFHVIQIIVITVAVFQCIVSVAIGHRHTALAEFGRRLSRYTAETVAYLTFGDDEPPYPLGQPQANPTSPTPSAAAPSTQPEG